MKKKSKRKHSSKWMKRMKFKKEIRNKPKNDDHNNICLKI